MHGWCNAIYRVAADMCCNEGWKIAKLMAADSELNASMAAIGAHYPATSQQVPALYHVDNTSNMPTEAALQLGTPLWASEARFWLYICRVVSVAIHERKPAVCM